MMSPTEVKVQLRPYQTKAIEGLRAAIRRGRKRLLLVIPTGGGKTLTSVALQIAAVAKGSRCLFVAHRKELIDQTVKAFVRLGVRTIGVIRASDPRRDASQPIQIASIQTLARRDQEDVDIIIIDEAHRALGASYLKHLVERHPKAIVIGLTATPVRADGKPLGTLFEDLVQGARYSELLAEGYIVAPLVYGTPVLPDLTNVRTSGGDYNVEDLDAAMNRGVLVGDIYTQWVKHPRQRTVVFAVSVAHSRAIVEMFRSHGVRAEHLDGETPEAERAEILERLESGKTEVVSNVGVLCEGWDLPACKTLILARPTKSLGLYMQMAGRILRPWEDVTPIIIDHGGNVDRHGLPHRDRDWSLSKTKKKRNAMRTKVCPNEKCFAMIASGYAACPHCGHVFTQESAEAEDAKEEIETVPIELELRTLEDDTAVDPMQLSFFRWESKRARERGYHAGYVAHRFAERFGGAEVPSDWMRLLREGLQRDDTWKAKRRERKAREQANRERDEADAA